METIREILKDDANHQVQKLTAYCFNDTTGWIERLFPLYNADKFRGIYAGTELCSCILARNFKAILYNTVQPLSGIACVASWPEKRNKGLVRKLLNDVILNEYNEGKIFSALYPFKFRFYEMFGYGLIGNSVSCTIDPENLKVTGKPAGEFIRFDQSDQQMTQIYAIRDQWVTGYNFGILAPRYPITKYIDDIRWLAEHEYLYFRGGECKAYVRFKLQPMVTEHSSHMLIKKIAWADSESFRALIHFLHAHRDQCRAIEWSIPSSLPLSLVLHDPRINMEIRHYWMGRPLNALKIIQLKLMSNPINGKLIFSIKDDIITANTGTYIIEGISVKQDSFKDINTIPLPLFSALLFGGYSPAETEFTGSFLQKDADSAGQFFKKDYNLYLSEYF